MLLDSKKRKKLCKFEKKHYLCTAIQIRRYLNNFKAWRVGRVIDRAGLEIRYTLMGIGGLNPSLSAKLNGSRKKASIFLVPENQLFIFVSPCKCLNLTLIRG